ncbi:asparagine synthase (glutamine-hydrolyzing) [Sulfurimonas marina]|uniref:asparagine synthase (glutamine-hydrolyzing) n=1 Tax=Sulfurimonas marina TaxID=2590551 RepID=A0A7M3V982_9BACT|nr:asparagine synthase (glutamine-hydrolyzing) [Sulfurimonas marina]QOP40315.1 asparagine synthase (glutamine-hydrolyzing) [Sulfurimonas marina]
MCAIFGILGQYNQKQARSALALLAHRGPDFCGITEEKNLFFAHQRLSINDTHHRSNQPLQYKNILLSFNGEIYNFQELKKELDFKFQTEGDTEVILAAYLKWGVNFVQHLRGMFAIALKDGDNLYLFRDRLGKKPVFYLHNKEAFYFSSELKALKPFLKNKELNQDAMLSYLTYLAPTSPHTFFQGIKKLAPSEYLVFKNDTVEVKRYFDLLDTTPNIITSETEAIAKIEELLQESIELRLSGSEVPMATLLSGGIDSATINYYAKNSGKDLLSYSLGFEEYRKYDELDEAKESARLLGVRNKAVIATKEKFIESFDPVLYALDEPLNDPAAIPLYILLEEVKKDGYKVVLSGEGSDELFLGYRQYFEYIELEKAKGLYHANWLKKYFRSNFSMNREWEWYKRAFENEVVFRCSSEKFTDMQKNQLLRRNIRDGESMGYIQAYRNRYEASAHKDESIWFSYIDLNHFQSEHFLTKLDRISMAHSIESRTPFLDHKFTELIFSIDPIIRYRDAVTKSLLKKTMANKLPETIINRKKKGFSNPYMEYLISSGKISLIEEVNEQTGMFKKDVLERYIATAKRGTFKQHIWGLYVLSHFMKREFL